jgi:2-phosphoglycolate phosphatase, prokaryotic
MLSERSSPREDLAECYTVLFDLDGTLVDTAPDMAHALNLLLAEQGRESLPFERIRPTVSDGSAGLIRLSLGLKPGDPDFSGMRRRFLALYEAHLYRKTVLFPGIEALLAVLEGGGFKWGVVTNKPAWLTHPLLEAMGLRSRAACVVSGDTTEQRKPHPLPLLHACELIGCPPEVCLYVGDAQRDIEAGGNAGMRTLIALYGYIHADERPEAWGADGLVRHPSEIANWLGW